MLPGRPFVELSPVSSFQGLDFALAERTVDRLAVPALVGALVPEVDEP